MGEIGIDVRNIEIQRGKRYGYLCLISLITLLPLAMILSPKYKQADQMSDLGIYSESAAIFSIMSIICGISLYQYFTLFLKNKFDSSNIQFLSTIIILGQIAAIGAIGLGIIPYYENFKEPHKWMATLAFSGLTISIFLLSYNYYRNDSRYYLAIFGFIIMIYSLLYPAYFRLQPTKGYFQKIYLFSIVIWHIILNRGSIDIAN